MRRISPSSQTPSAKTRSPIPVRVASIRSRSSAAGCPCSFQTTIGVWQISQSAIQQSSSSWYQWVMRSARQSGHSGSGGATPTIFTVGHSTRSLEEFVELLREHSIATLADVRTVPASRRVPHFARASLERTLPERGIAYVHLPELGGLRRPRPDSGNGAWRSASFRGYADHMETAEFAAGLARLLDLPRPVALMCAEAVPWRCHRSLIADALLARGEAVEEIIGPGSERRHEMTPFARVRGARVTYPG
jgi:uncharacterized protein DUF488